MEIPWHILLVGLAAVAATGFAIHLREAATAKRRTAIAKYVLGTLKNAQTLDRFTLVVLIERWPDGLEEYKKKMDTSVLAPYPIDGDDVIDTAIAIRLHDTTTRHLFNDEERDPDGRDQRLRDLIALRSQPLPEAVRLSSDGRALRAVATGCAVLVALIFSSEMPQLDGFFEAMNRGDGLVGYLCAALLAGGSSWISAKPPRRSQERSHVSV